MVRWTLATMTSCAIVGLIGHFPYSFPPGYSDPQRSLFENVVFAAVFGLFIGGVPAVLVGAAQWLVHRELGLRWVVLTALGFALSHAIGDAVFAVAPLRFSPFTVVALAPLGGSIVGALQARGPTVPPGWIAASALAWTIGLAVAVPLLDVLGILEWQGPALAALAHAVAGASVGLSAGVAGGMLLTRQRETRRPSPRAG